MVHKFVDHNFVYRPHFSAFSPPFCLFAPKNRELINIIHRINKYDKSN